MKYFNIVVSTSVILLFLGSSALSLEPSSNSALWNQEPNYHPAFLAPQEHRDLQFCSSNATCSCALSVSDVSNNGCSYNDNSRCSITCPGVCNGADLRIGSAAICPNGACEIAATCDNGSGCIGPCNALATTLEEYCTPIGCSSSQSTFEDSKWWKTYWYLELASLPVGFIFWWMYCRGEADEEADEEADGEAEQAEETDAVDEKTEEAEQDSSV